MRAERLHQVGLSSRIHTISSRKNRELGNRKTSSLLMNNRSVCLRLFSFRCPFFVKHVDTFIHVCNYRFNSRVNKVSDPEEDNEVKNTS